MSVKIGIGFGGWPFPSADPEHLWEYTDLCEEYGVDSLWLSDRIVSEALNMEPMIASSQADAHYPPSDSARARRANTRPAGH